MSRDQELGQRPGGRQLGEILQRIDERLRELNMSQRAAAREAGLSPAQIRTMRRQYAEGKQHGASVRTIGGLAHALKLRPEWLVSGIGPKELAPSETGLNRSGRGLRLSGAVVAGVWREGEVGTDQPRFSLVPPDPRYPAEYQSAYEVQGTSLDRVAQPGDFLIVVDRNKMDLPLRSGDLLVSDSAQGGRTAGSDGPAI